LLTWYLCCTVYLQIWEYVFWYLITCKTSFHNSRPLQHNDLKNKNPLIMHNDVHDMHHYTHTLYASFSHATCAKTNICQVHSFKWRLLLILQPASFWSSSVFSFTMGDGTKVAVHIWECKLQSTVELMSVVTFWTGTAAGDLSVECFCPAI